MECLKNGFLKFGICGHTIADNLKDDLHDESTDEELSHDEIINTVVPRYSESLGTQVSIHYNEVSQ
jgi:hypothetical protein